MAKTKKLTSEQRQLAVAELKSAMMFFMREQGDKNVALARIYTAMQPKAMKLGLSTSAIAAQLKVLSDERVRFLLQARIDGLDYYRYNASGDVSTKTEDFGLKATIEYGSAATEASPRKKTRAEREVKLAELRSYLNGVMTKVVDFTPTRTIGDMVPAKELTSRGLARVDIGKQLAVLTERGTVLEEKRGRARYYKRKPNVDMAEISASCRTPAERTTASDIDKLKKLMLPLQPPQVSRDDLELLRLKMVQDGHPLFACYLQRGVEEVDTQARRLRYIHHLYTAGQKEEALKILGEYMSLYFSADAEQLIVESVARAVLGKNSPQQLLREIHTSPETVNSKATQFTAAMQRVFGPNSGLHCG